MTKRFLPWLTVGACCAIALHPCSAVRAEWEIRGPVTDTDAFEFSMLAVVADSVPITVTRNILMMPGQPSGVSVVPVVVDPEDVDSALFGTASLPNTSNFAVSHYNWLHPGPGNYYASVVNSFQLYRLSSTDGLSYSSSLVSTTTGYFSSEAARSDDTDYIAGYHLPTADYHVYTATQSSSTYTLADTITGTVVETIQGWPRTGFAVNPADTYCIAYWLAQNSTQADGFYECPPGSAQQFHDNLPVISAAFPEAISRFVSVGQTNELFVYLYVCGPQVCGMWTDGSATFQSAVLGPGPTLNAQNRFYSIGLTQVITDSSTVEAAWPDQAVKLDLTTSITAPLGDYPFDQLGPNGLVPYDLGGQPTLAALGNGSVLLATLTGGAGVRVPTLSWWGLVAGALALAGLGSFLITHQRPQR